MAAISQTKILSNLAAAIMGSPTIGVGRTLEPSKKRAMHQSLRRAARDYFGEFLEEGLISSPSNLDVTKAVMLRLANLSSHHSIDIRRMGESSEARYINSALQCLRRDIAAGCIDEMRPIVPDIFRQANSLRSDFPFLTIPVLDELIHHAIEKADVETLLVAYVANDPDPHRTPKGINISREAILTSLHFVGASTSSEIMTYVQSCKAYKAIEGAAAWIKFAEAPEFKLAHGDLWVLLDKRGRVPRQEALDAMVAQLQAAATQSSAAVRPVDRNGSLAPSPSPGSDPA